LERRLRTPDFRGRLRVAAQAEHGHGLQTAQLGLVRLLEAWRDEQRTAREYYRRCVVVLADFTDGVFALVGVLLGGLLTSAWAYISERRKIRTSLYVAAFSCLTRWRKVESARRTKPASLDNEVTKLGRDLDAYMVAIPQVVGRRERNRHWVIYDEMVKIFGERDLAQPLPKDAAQKVERSVDGLDEEVRREFGRRSFLVRLFRRGHAVPESSPRP